MINEFDISHGSLWGWRRMEAELLLRETNNVFSLASPPLRVSFSFLRRKRSDRPVADGQDFHGAREPVKFGGSDTNGAGQRTARLAMSVASS